MPMTKAGAAKIAARRLKIPLKEYNALVESGKKWCTSCAQWLPVNDFGHDKSRSDGREARCRSCRRRPSKKP